MLGKGVLACLNAMSILQQQFRGHERGSEAGMRASETDSPVGGMRQGASEGERVRCL